MKDQSLYQKQKLLIADADEGTASAMLAFGEVVFSEVLQRSAQIDSKLSGYVAYATGLIALLSIGSAGSNPVKHPVLFAALILAVLPACVAIGFSAYGLKARVHDVPGDEVWINEFKSDLSLRKSYVVALLKSRTLQRELNRLKADAMRNAEVALMLAGLAAGAILICRIFS